MSAGGEFYYRLRVPVSGYRPGAHASATMGTGQHFAAHARLLDSADPRRLDIRASVRNVRREWLVKQYRQRAAVSVYALVDVSASMHFGVVSKLERVAAFAQSLGYSAFRSGDPAGLFAFDSAERADLYLPARMHRGVGVAMGDLLRAATVSGGPASGAGLLDAAEKLAGKHALVFVVSDFHWPLNVLPDALDHLAQASVVPMVVWDDAEITPPSSDGLLMVRDAESGARRTVWMRAKTRAAWRASVAARRGELQALFAAHDLRPFFMRGNFEPESLSRYFMEERL